MIKEEHSLCGAAVMLTFPPFWFGRRQFQKTIFNFLFGGENKTESYWVLDKSNWRKKKCLKQSLNKKGCLWGGGVCVCACTCTPAFSVPHTLTLRFYVTMTERGMFALHTPDSPILPPQWNDSGNKKKEWDEQTVEGISQLNISGTFPSSTPLSVFIKPF